MLYAIIIGINKYEDKSIQNLLYARADAEAMAKMVEARIDPSEHMISLLRDSEATKRNIMVAIGEDLPRSASKDDIILIYFAGHGSPETLSSPDQVSRYLVAHDTEYENIYATGIDMEREITRLFERIVEPSLMILFIDACFSGRAGGRTFEGPHLTQVRTRFRTTGPISLKELDLGEGRLMISACDDDQVAKEEKSLGHGIFTYFLLEHLKGSTLRSKTISVHLLYDKVAHSVRAYTHGRQTPIINGRASVARLPRL